MRRGEGDQIFDQYSPRHAVNRAVMNAKQQKRSQLGASLNPLGSKHALLGPRFKLTRQLIENLPDGDQLLVR